MLLCTASHCALAHARLATVAGCVRLLAPLTFQVREPASPDVVVASLLFGYAAALTVRWDASPWLQCNVRVNVKVPPGARSVGRLR